MVEQRLESHAAAACVQLSPLTTRAATASSPQLGLCWPAGQPVGGWLAMPPAEAERAALLGWLWCSP